MRTPYHRLVRRAARGAPRKFQAMLPARQWEAPEVFSDREEDAEEYLSILRSFSTVHDETLGAERDG